MFGMPRFQDGPIQKCHTVSDREDTAYGDSEKRVVPEEPACFTAITHTKFMGVTPPKHSHTGSIYAEAVLMDTPMKLHKPNGPK